jgi:DNA-binding NtrC family response regulator
MPGKSGMDLLHEVRKMGLTMPFVFLTAHQNKENFQDAIRLGAIDYLIKPFSSEDLCKTVNRLLEVGVRMKEVHSMSSPDLGKKMKMLNQLRAVSRRKAS